MLTFLFANLLVVLSAAAVTAQFNPRRAIDCILVFFTSAVTQIVVTLLIGGALLHQLRPIPIIALNLLVALVAVGTYLKGQRKPDIQALGNWAIGFWRELKSHPWALLLTFFVGAELVWLTTLTYLFPLFDYDGLAYHLVAVASWIQQGSIHVTPYLFWSNVYPQNVELLFTWLMLFTRTDTWVELGQFAFALGGAGAVMGLARVAGLSRPAALAAGNLYFLTPIVLLQARTAYVDVSFASMYLIAFYFVVRYLKLQSLRYLFVGGIAGGLALGMKSSGLAYVGILGMIVVGYLGWKIWRREARLRQGLGAVAMFGLPILLLGTYWYLRTWVVYGNPLYPFSVTVLGHSLFPSLGPVHEMIMIPNTPPEIRGKAWWLQLLMSWWRDADLLHSWSSEIRYRYDQGMGGFGPQWTFMELPALVMLTIHAFVRRRDLLLLTLPLLVTFLIQPSNWWSRYTITIVAIGAIALVYLLERLERRGVRGILWGMASCLVLISMYHSLPHLILPPRVALETAKLPADERTIGRLFFHEFRWVDALPPGARIAFTGTHPFTYPLFGSHLQHTVIPFEARQEDEFVRLLRDSNPSHLFTREDTDYDRWARQRPEIFETLDTVSGYRAYKLLVTGER